MAGSGRRGEHAARWLLGQRATQRGVRGHRRHQACLAFRCDVGAQDDRAWEAFLGGHRRELALGVQRSGEIESVWCYAWVEL